MLKLWVALIAFWSWTEGALWRSWITHTAGALLLSIPFGGKAAFVAFLLREAEQLFFAAKSGKFEKWYDYPMDLVGPALVWLVLG